MGGLRYTMDLVAGHTAQCGPAAVESCHAEVSMITWHTCTCLVTVTCLLCALCALRRSSGGETMKWFGMPPTALERVADRTHVEMKIVKKYPLFYIFVIISCHLNLLPTLIIALKILDLV